MGEDPLVPTESSPLVKNGTRLLIFLVFALMIASGVLSIVNGLQPNEQSKLVIGVAMLILAVTTGVFVKWIADGTIEEQKITRVIFAQIIMMLVVSSSLLAVYYGPKAPENHILGGIIKGLDSRSGPVTLQLNGSVTAQASGGTGCAPFLFRTTVPAGSNPKIEIKSQPQNAFCSVSGIPRTVTKDVNNIVVSCVKAYMISGTVQGLQGKGLTLSNNKAQIIPIETGATHFQFDQGVVSPYRYDVEVNTQPKDPDQKCVASENRGTAKAAVNDVKISCST